MVDQAAMPELPFPPPDIPHTESLPVPSELLLDFTANQPGFLLCRRQ